MNSYESDHIRLMTNIVVLGDVGFFLRRSPRSVGVRGFLIFREIPQTRLTRLDRVGVGPIGYIKL